MGVRLRRKNAPFPRAKILACPSDPPRPKSFSERVQQTLVAGSLYLGFARLVEDVLSVRRDGEEAAKKKVGGRGIALSRRPRKVKGQNKQTGVKKKKKRRV